MSKKLYKVNFTYSVFILADNEENAKDESQCYLGDIVEFEDPEKQVVQVVENGVSIPEEKLNQQPFVDNFDGVEEYDKITIIGLAKDQGWVKPTK